MQEKPHKQTEQVQAGEANDGQGSFKKKRLESLDALRGFDMFMITGGAAPLLLLEGKTGWGWIDMVADQLKHPKWDGFTFYDFIFPLFLFMSGVSMVYSINNSLKSGATHSQIYKSMFKRMLILVFLGILDKNNPLTILEPGNIRFGSVLGRIGVACFFATVLYLNFPSPKKLLYISAGILVVYCAAVFLIPVPGYGAGDLSFEGNLPGWIDRTVMPGRLLQGTYDELAFGTFFSASCLTIFGLIAGDTLRSSVTGEYSKVLKLTVMGILGVLLGLIWGTFFPINKHMWSSSFILLTGGMAFLFMAFFYWIIDVLGYKKWAFFFKVIGVNSLVIYLGTSLISFRYSSERLFKGFYMYAPEEWHAFYQSLGTVALVWLFLYFLYRNKIFVKI